MCISAVCTLHKRATRSVVPYLRSIAVSIAEKPVDEPSDNSWYLMSTIFRHIRRTLSKNGICGICATSYPDI
jgi:hypothetical protein